jgi:hypothetical protein
MSAPCLRSSPACPTRSTPTTQPKPPARPASTPQGIFEHGTLRRRDGELARTLEKEVGCGLSPQVLLLAQVPVYDLFE